MCCLRFVSIILIKSQVGYLLLSFGPVFYSSILLSPKSRTIKVNWIVIWHDENYSVFWLHTTVCMSTRLFSTITFWCTCSSLSPFDDYTTDDSIETPTLLSLSSTCASTFFQNQCFLQINAISSMGTPLVSGKKRETKMVMTVIQPAKNRNIPNLSEQRRERKACAIMKVNKRFTATVMLCPADRISKGNISLGIVHPSGPQDHPNATTKRQITTTTNIE